MHPPDCPFWEYTEIAHHRYTLKSASRDILVELRNGLNDSVATIVDSRSIHHRLFKGLTPLGFDYFAGHYRGEPFRCLKYYTVGVQNDARVGCEPGLVTDRMNDLAGTIKSLLHGLDAASDLPHSQLSAEEKLLYAVAVACRVFELFLRIHPYANGNGHAARFCLIAILGRYQYWLKKFPVEPRPQDPPYTEAIIEYRNGNPEPLEAFILGCL
jgi:fido (protein-threonine AMPylation protein)